MLPPGCAKLVASPAWTGSPPTQTIGIVSGRADRLRDGVGVGNDYARVPADDLASESGIALGQPLAGIPLDGEVLSFDIAQSAQLLEKWSPEPISWVVDASGRT